MLKGGLVLIWELDMNLKLTLLCNHKYGIYSLCCIILKETKYIGAFHDKVYIYAKGWPGINFGA